MVRSAGEVRAGLPSGLLCVSGSLFGSGATVSAAVTHRRAPARVYLNAPVVLVKYLDVNGLQLCPLECFHTANITVVGIYCRQRVATASLLLPPFLSSFS